ncbi:MAG: hypothetical protein PF574_03430 [Candidatus Delongbacteria bacterium]|jgi:bifunctional N-acetylglucosamine-1-phosphate-uridyltransferase/glucosamine-1-phosphate-acetyltransferase GlmU-like protein|nr:hypothetical protein [Candidatus Delongbacteria bacterium]
MINLEKFNINLDKRLTAQIIFFLAILVFVIGFFMFINGLNRHSISGIRKDSGRVEFEFYDHYLYMFPHNVISYAPVTDIKYYKSDSKDKPSNPLIVFFTTTDDFKFYAEENNISVDDLKKLDKELNVFMNNEELKEFGDSFFYLKFYGIIGLLMTVLTGYFIIPLFKRIPKKTEEEKKEFKAKIIKKIQDIKKIKNVTVKRMKEKKPGITKEIISGDRLLKILVPVYDKNINFKSDVFKTPYTHSIALACTSSQKLELQEQHGNDFEYFVTDKNTNTAEMVMLAENWVKDFKGYLMVQTENIPELTSSMVSDFYKEHKGLQNESTILVTESSESNIPSGKLIKNMANRIVDISATPEPNDPGQIAEVSLGLFCFNIKKIFGMIRDLGHGDSYSEVIFTRIFEVYHKNRSKLNTFVVKNAQKQNIQSSITSTKQTISATKKIAALIISTQDYNPEKLTSSVEALTPEIEIIYLIISSEHQEEAKELLGENVTYVISEGKIGDADDILKTNDYLRNFNGLVLVITEDIVDISKDKISKLLTEHTNQNNICSFVKNEDKNTLYCTDAFQFLYAVKMIGRNAITRKYHLSDLINILIDAKKRVQEIDM